MSVRYFTVFLLCISFSTKTFAGDYEEAWKALAKNDRKTARDYLQKSFNDPVHGADAYITYMYLASFEGDDKLTEFIPKVYDKLSDPNPYVYAMWFEKGVLGSYGKKTREQQRLLDKILNDGKCNGSLVSAAHYVQSWAYLAANDIQRSVSEAAKMGSVGPLWQLVGPFDNLSGSGFNKDYGPLQHPEPEAVFKSAANADIKWFTPPMMNRDGWTFPYGHIRYSTGVIYAQNFINAPEDMKVLLNVGFNGAIKVWVNDELVITEKKELVTEVDYCKNYVELKKGFNRLLIQVSYTNNSFPNFIIRLTDDKCVPVKGLTYTAELQKYPLLRSDKQPAGCIRHFTEAFFEEKIKQEPDNLINYFLLSETYLRNKRTSEARALIEKVVQKFPDNPLLRLELMSCYVKEGNSTLLQQETERMKEKDPECLIAAKLNIEQLMQNEKYQEVDEEIKKYDAHFGDDDNDMFNTKVRLYSAQNKMKELVNLIEKNYKNHPEEPSTVTLMSNVKMNVNKDVKGALQVYENYLKNNYNYEIVQKLADEYKKQGMADKQLRLLKEQSDNFPYDPELYNGVANYYFAKQDYNKATEWARKALSLAPYVSTYWENLGVELQQQHADEEAVNALKKAVYYSANNYTAREQLREIQKKPSVWKAFPETDVYELIRHSDSTVKDYNFYYLLDEQFAVVYPEGACEEYYTYVIKILNDKGIDDWKETNISYNSNTSYLIIEKAEAVKKNGVKNPADQNDNQLVFTGLEAGDFIVLKYKIQHYERGRLAKEYWNKFLFNSYVPEKISRYCLLVANNIKINSKVLNANIQPTTSAYDDFTLYTWEMKNSVALKSETYMPPLGDVAASVMVSTIPSWSQIAGWYSDISSDKTEDELEVKHVFNELFPNGVRGLSQRAVAKTIYNYISKNIRYSSVSFRQSGFTPQKPSVTINTGLGDCKDLSTLFTALAKMAGIKANLVLLSTRNYGQKIMSLPSVEFNHCIVQTQLDDKTYFLELTDNTLPFASLPSDLNEAPYLVIPANSKDTAEAKLGYIDAVNRVHDKSIRKAQITINNNDIDLKVTVTKTGNLTSPVRDKYFTISEKEQKEEMEKSISGKYKNAVKLSSLSFTGLDALEDSVSYNCNYTVKDEISELGDIKMLKIPFEDIVATMDNFSLSERKFPVEYYRYEEVDEYETTIEITAPTGTKFVELPKDQTFNFLGSTYTLKYVQKNKSHLIIVRKAALKKSNVAPENYAAMKDFLNNIVKSESKFIAFKNEQ